MRTCTRSRSGNAITGAWAHTGSMRTEAKVGLTMATAWSRAARLADRTPASRNRYVDFLRAASMLVVTVGHWLAAAPYFDASGELIGAHILTAVPWTAWLRGSCRSCRF